MTDAFRRLMVEFEAEDSYEAWSPFKRAVLAEIARVDEGMHDVARESEHWP